MNYYENNCRICKKVFCCKKCREKHEMRIHEIFVTCDICIYGKAFLKDPSEGLIKHIQSRHWPLHCVLCKRFFGSMEEFLKKSNCQMKYKNKEFDKILYTPIQNNENGDSQESPLHFLKDQLAPNNCMFLNLATSTPLQREENSLSKKNNELVTPVDISDINKGKKYSSENASLQRKVTFYETPVMEPEYIIKPEKFEGRITVTPCSENSAMFHSANDQQENLILTHQNSVNMTPAEDETNIKEKNSENGPEDTTLWISAMNTPSPVVSDTQNEKFVDKNSTTPFVSKLKKRQINVVMPITMKKNDDDSEPFHATSVNNSEINIPITLNVPTRTNFFKKMNVESNVFSIKTSDTKVLSETSINAPQRLWTSVSRLVRNVANVVQDFPNVTYTFKTPLKRSISEDSTDSPSVKRYKLTEIKCRRPIRDLSTTKYSIEFDESVRYTNNSLTVGIKKTFIDKATQTD